MDYRNYKRLFESKNESQKRFFTLMLKNVANYEGSNP